MIVMSRGCFGHLCWLVRLCLIL